MSLKSIKKQLKDAGLNATARYLGNEIRAKGYSIHDSTCMYEITFPKIEGEEYYDDPIEIIGEGDAYCAILEYLKCVLKQNR